MHDLEKKDVEYAESFKLDTYKKELLHIQNKLNKENSWQMLITSEKKEKEE